jgi:hypothetical protein
LLDVFSHPVILFSHGLSQASVSTGTVAGYLTGITAEVQLSDRAAHLVSLADAVCISAETAGKTIQSRWQKGINSDKFPISA